MSESCPLPTGRPSLLAQGPLKMNSLFARIPPKLSTSLLPFLQQSDHTLLGVSAAFRYGTCGQRFWEAILTCLIIIWRPRSVPWPLRSRYTYALYVTGHWGPWLQHPDHVFSQELLTDHERASTPLGDNWGPLILAAHALLRLEIWCTTCGGLILTAYTDICQRRMAHCSVCCARKGSQCSRADITSICLTQDGLQVHFRQQVSQLPHESVVQGMTILL
jgi:hypothetical protein